MQHHAFFKNTIQAKQLLFKRASWDGGGMKDGRILSCGLSLRKATVNQRKVAASSAAPPFIDSVAAAVQRLHSFQSLLLVECTEHFMPIVCSAVIGFPCLPFRRPLLWLHYHLLSLRFLLASWWPNSGLLNVCILLSSTITLFKCRSSRCCSIDGIRWIIKWTRDLLAIFLSVLSQFNAGPLEGSWIENCKSVGWSGC